MRNGINPAQAIMVAAKTPSRPMVAWIFRLATLMVPSLRTHIVDVIKFWAKPGAIKKTAIRIVSPKRMVFYIGSPSCCKE